MSEPVGSPRPFRVRPYTLTGGRTRAAVQLGLDTLLRSVDGGASPHRRSGGRLRLILELCDRPTALAEVAGRVGQPLQVVSILVGDLVDAGALRPVVPAPGRDRRPDVRLLERVLDGLNSL